jgi:hypothetical protein
MLKTIDTHIRDLERMDIQAERIYKSITDLLDLKQKHANAFEARFARDQAAGTARQSQTIMVFTIVTIIFLPLSFIAALFTINIEEFPHKPDGGEPSLPMKWVFKFMFGIGLAISIPFIAIALSYDAIGDFFREVRRRFRDHRRPTEQVQSRPTLGTDIQDFEYAVDMRALEQALSVGRSTVRPDGRRSIESYLNRGYGGRATSRSTARSGGKEGVLVSKSNMTKVNGRLSVEVNSPVERISTGFRMRGSGDAERGS